MCGPAGQASVNGRVAQAQRGAADGGVGAAPGAPGGGHVPRARAGRRLGQGRPRAARAADAAAGRRAARAQRARRTYTARAGQTYPHIAYGFYTATTVSVSQ